MKRKKDFDCVEMKNGIQAKLLEEYAGLTREEIREKRRQRIEADPVLGPLFGRTKKAGVGD